MDNLEEVTTKVTAVLDYIRPYLQIDGGDVELVGVSDDGIVQVKLLGACDKCAMRPMTLRAGIERAIMNSVPEIIRIESIN
ncbi:MAG: NifU family protein [Ignavibacteria bacterium]|jgi:Fe-S cluster biogenesis protein NfuA